MTDKYLKFFFIRINHTYLIAKLYVSNNFMS